MTYRHSDIAEAAVTLLRRFDELSDKTAILRAVELKALYDQIRTLPPEQRASFGQELNALRTELQSMVDAEADKVSDLPPIDVTAPMDANAPIPDLLYADQGSTHPLTQEITRIIDIFARMGFVAEESREIDDQYHMFESLNFPKGHPARDDWDTFMTVEKDAEGEAFIAPAHTSTMQNRILRKYAVNLEKGEPIAAITPDRTFRNEDLDARHEHTFYQVEGVFVSKGVHAGMLVATLQKFLEEYFGQSLEVRVNPFYFPFTEPSFEFALSCPFCQKAGCNICSQSGWIELLGCGMIHPNVLRAGGIDPEVYSGFAFGCGIDRLVMMKHGIEDVRHLESAKLDFLRQF
ncbi:phenylalanine--tRNA ligase subunit alpha [Candidatus Saccharibacteria bacterium]|nr:phenylalanine--tRNA ligase subunit alpha [Candidatus Saccharibacteria bacterium]